MSELPLIKETPDDRIKCTECHHLQYNGVCSAFNSPYAVDVLSRCYEYKPKDGVGGLGAVERGWVKEMFIVGIK